MIRLVTFLGIILLLSSCQSQPLSPTKNNASQVLPSKPLRLASNIVSKNAAPKWFASQALHRSNFYIGYGAATRLDLAKSYARADLSKQLSSQIQSRLTQSTQDQENRVEVITQRHISELSHANLSDLVVLKSEQKSGRYYVALGMDTTPLIQRIQQTFGHLSAENKVSLLNTSNLFKRYQNQYGYFPDLVLTSMSGQYYLIHGHQRLILKTSDLQQIMPQVQSSAVSFQLNPNKRTLKPEENYQVKFNLAHSGYLTYLQVFENGEVVVLFANQKLSTSRFSFPDLNQYDGLTAELDNNEQSTQDLHIALLCPNQRDFSALEAVSTQAHQHYDVAGLVQLNALSKQCQMTTKWIRIKR